jgi:predicted phosphodiesterase
MRIGFLSDIHEDILSLDLALGILAGQQCDTLVCLGDIVGFALPFYQHIQTRSAETCIDRIRAHCTVAVAGNHDLYAVRRVPEFKAGFEFGPDWYGLDYDIRASRARDRIWLYEDNEIPPVLSTTAADYLRDLQETGRITLDGTSCLLSHFCYPDLSGSAIHFPSQAFHLRKHFEFMRRHGCRIGVSGHGHPEGCLIVDEDRFVPHPFGTIPLTDEPQWIVAPPVARTSRANGCMVLDTEQRLVHVFPLRHARTMQQ